MKNKSFEAALRVHLSDILEEEVAAGNAGNDAYVQGLQYSRINLETVLEKFNISRITTLDNPLPQNELPVPVLVGGDVYINKKTLINAIAVSSIEFGHAFKGLYVNVNGCIQITDNVDAKSKDLMLLLLFSRMAEYTDDNGWYPNNENYDANAMAAHIVNDRDALLDSGKILKEDGKEVEYSFILLPQ